MAKAKSTHAAQSEQSATPALKAMSAAELRTKFKELVGTPTRSRVRAWLIRKIQAASRAATETPTPAKPKRDPRLPRIGRTLTRTYKGTDYKVKVLTRGFQYDGKRFLSLSAVAIAITGQHINGFKFFGLLGK